eukprot:gene5646-biopygen13274
MAAQAEPVNLPILKAPILKASILKVPVVLSVMNLPKVVCQHKWGFLCDRSRGGEGDFCATEASGEPSGACGGRDPMAC